MNIAVLCSGNGTNLQAIIDAQRKGQIKATISLVVSDNPNAYALTRAKNANINTFVLKRKDFSSKQEFENRVITELEKNKIDLIVLAGFMRMLSPVFIKKFKNKVLNIHPALLPSFGGTAGVKDAFAHGVKVTGPTVHFVDEQMDNGPIILQKAVTVEESDTIETLTEKIHKEEHIIYPQAIQLFIEGRLKVEGRKVRILQCVLAFFICSLSVMTADALTTQDTMLPVFKTPVLLKQPIQEKTIQLKPDQPNLPRLDAPQPIKPEILQEQILSIQEVQRSSNIKTFKSRPDALDTYFKNITNDEQEQFSKDDIAEKKIKFAQKALEGASEMADSMDLAPVSNILETGKKIIDVGQTIKKKYNLHLKLDTKKAFISYRKKF